MQSKENKFSKSLKSRKLRMSLILDILSKSHSDARIALNFSNPLELLIATILSAQCTDERVNKVTLNLFNKYKVVEDYINVENSQLEKDIFSTGFYKNKAKNIKNACKKIVEHFNGKVPSNMDDLLTLDGVGRKTANVVLGHCFNTPGIVVDTHVKRISNRLGMVFTEDPVKIEFELMKIIPKEVWIMFTHYIILHGRKICKSRKPDCKNCPISKYCPSYK